MFNHTKNKDIILLKHKDHKVRETCKHSNTKKWLAAQQNLHDCSTATKVHKLLFRCWRENGSQRVATVGIVPMMSWLAGEVIVCTL